MNKRKNNGITLIALVVIIIILLVLAGVVIATLGGENGLIARAKQAKQAQIESDMKEQLILAMQDLQIEKLGDATLDDITQEWIDSKIKDYECTVKDDLSVSGKKVTMEKGGIIGKFLIDERLNITEIEENGSGAKLEYEVVSRNGEKVTILLTITDKENGLQQVEFPDGNIIYCNGNEEFAKDYEVQLGVEYKVKITSKGGQVKEETILINDYYHKITKNLGEGISIDNSAVKAAYNKPYQATITAGDEYLVDTITVTMGGQEVTADKETGIINIEKVTGDIEITATAKKLEIQITTPIINTNASATSSLEANTQTKGSVTLYINFAATLEGTNCTIEPAVPYSVTSNGKYKFTATGTYQNKTITKEIEVTVNQYQSAQGLVQYDAGDWTEGEINSLKNSKLYDLNASHSGGDGTYKLNDERGLNFTFGGFTYKGDTANENTAGVITSRNQSVSPQSGYGTPKYDGWQVLESKEENGKTYVTKLVHAGTPENFVYYYTTSYDVYRAEYLLSNGQRQTGWSTLSNGTAINPRSWDMYKDKELDAKGYIKEVHAMTYSEAYAITNSTGIRNTGSYYWLGSAGSSICLWGVYSGGDISVNYGYCWGVRPVVSLESGVYIAGGDGTEASPYILAKE